MQQIINFLIKYRNFLLFAFLLLLSLLFTIQSHTYHRSRFVNSANFVSGNVYDAFNNVDEYFDLKKHNEELTKENRRLREMVYGTKDSIPQFQDSIELGASYRFTIAKVINNNYTHRNNYLTLRGGLNDSIKPDMGVITSNGVVGIVDNVSANYATVISILNGSSQINAKLKKSNHLGSLVWNGKSPAIAQLIDVQEKASVNVGDTIITGGMSTIFPEGIRIGTIQDFELNPRTNLYTIDVKLFNDLTNLGHVYIIENMNREEILSLEEEVQDEQ